MARRIPKFPLKMANGASVRTIEDLRANADVDSIIAYFFSGQLETWCRAFGYDTLPEEFNNINAELIRSIYQTLDIHVDDAEIRNYVATHGIHPDTTTVVSSAETNEIEDNETIKRKLKAYVDSNISLSDYAVEVLPVNDDNGRLCKYKINIANLKTAQYSSFVLPYDIGRGYTKEMFEDDLYKKVAYIIKAQHEENAFLKLRHSRYAGLKAGDTFPFGNYEGKTILWRVLHNDGKNLISISVNVISEMHYYRPTESSSGIYGGLMRSLSHPWKECNIRKWLNKEFYDSAFSDSERKLIAKTMYDHGNESLADYFLILDGDSLINFFEDAEDMKTDKAYWTREDDSSPTIRVVIDSKTNPTYPPTKTTLAKDVKGVRPVFSLKY